jgi:hypothetical protein
MREKVFFLLFITCFVFSDINAQYVKVVNDFRSRTSFGVEKELINNLNLYGEVELGLEQDWTKIGRLKAETGLNYTPYKFLELETNYRFSRNRRNYRDKYKYTHTFALSGEAKHKVDRFRLSYRLQFQNIDDDATSYTEFNEHRNILKTRFRAKYNIRKSVVTPFVSTELYFSPEKAGLNTTKLKSMAGIDYKLMKRDVIRIYYRNDRELSNFLPFTYHTIGFAYLMKL